MNQNYYNNQANVVENQYPNIGKNSNSESLFLASNSFIKDENTWYLDSGYNNHMCKKKELLSLLDKTINLIVKFGSNTNIPILRIG